ncbi:thioesterase family protein [Roseicyclus marinus]|uniref:thioesterase family protein n=1 Tax=Roseicyclus marinus TaxID=2161673 RepID=UPI00240F8A8A|nr:thioesterase family protein [Roseicyclus marinus]MDG3040626.1 3-hydroxyacyl-CoA dehydrogenase NAD-binding domain-containing protein [Roseicyclus marinus]
MSGSTATLGMVSGSAATSGMVSGIAAVLGAGTIGAGWAARLALMGWEVRVFDPEGAEDLPETLARARASLPALYDVPLPPEGRVLRAATIPEAVTGADWVQEAAPDRLELKRKLFQLVQAHVAPGVLLASSSAGHDIAALRGCATRPEQALRLRPVDPVYLMPTLRVEGQGAEARLASIGMGQGDVAAATSLAAIGGGEPEARDAALVTILRGLKDRGAALAAPIIAHQAALSPAPADPDARVIPVTLDRQVPVTWVDYNGHMNEARFVTAFSEAADRLLLWAGMDAAAIAAGHSVFTVETHVRYLSEVQIGDRIQVTTRVLAGGGRKFHIWHELWVGDTLCATGEQLLLHVDLETRRSALPPPAMADWLARAAANHAALPTPEGLGRHVGQRP